MTISQTTANLVLGVQVHRAPVRPADSSRVAQNDTSGRNMTQGARRMIAVTVALSEPADCAELDWADTIAANLRLIYRNTTVEIIDTWRVDA